MSAEYKENFCGYCGGLADEDDGGHELTPGSDEFICGSCYVEHFMNTCVLCAESFEKPEHSGEPEYFIVGRSSLDNWDIDSKRLPPGLYRITGYPHYAGSLIETHLYYDRWQRIGDLFRADPPDFDDYPMGVVCPGCAKKRLAKAEEIARSGVERMTMWEWRSVVGRQPVSAEHKAYRCPGCGGVQSAASMVAASGVGINWAKDNAMLICSACKLALRMLYSFEPRLGKPHRVAVEVELGKFKPAFAPVTPEGAVRFMAGGKEAQCRECGNKQVFGDNHWVEPDLCWTCQQYLERKRRVCRVCGRSGEQVPYGGISYAWAKPDLCRDCVDRQGKSYE